MCKAMLNCLHKGEHNEVFEETTGSKDRLHHGNTSFSILDFCSTPHSDRLQISRNKSEEAVRYYTGEG